MSKALAMMLVAMLAALLGYTAIVIANHGMDLLPIFFGDIARWTWPGQFNLDFLMMLILSASWTAWRNRFRPAGLCLALLAFGFGAGFQLIHLLCLMFRHGGNWSAILLGEDYQRKSYQ